MDALAGLDLLFPNRKEQVAHLLHDRHGYIDRDIARLMNLSRVHVNRLRSSFRKKIDTLRGAVPPAARHSIDELLAQRNRVLIDLAVPESRVR